MPRKATRAERTPLPAEQIAAMMAEAERRYNDNPDSAYGSAHAILALCREIQRQAKVIESSVAIQRTDEGNRPAVIVISDWLLNCRNDQWTPFEAASNLEHALQKEGYVIVHAKVIEELKAKCA